MEKRSSSVFRIDEKVFYTMGSIAIICLVILGFSFSHPNTCKDPYLTITKSAAHYYTGNVISFHAESLHGRRFLWDFGDSSAAEQGGSSIPHEFKYAGTYTVKVLVDGTCEQVIPVEINDRPVLMVKNDHTSPVIIFPDTAYMNRPVEFTDVTDGASAWEWYFNGSRSTENNTRIATHSFSIAGRNEISLKVNGSQDRVVTREIFIIDLNAVTKKNIVVNSSPRETPLVLLPIKERPTNPALGSPLPSGPAEVNSAVKLEIKKIADIPNGDVEVLLRKIISGESKALDPYVAEHVDVKYNGQTMTYAQMCEKLGKIKKIKNLKKLEVITVGKDATTKAIKYLDIVIENKNIFNRVFN